MNKRRITQPEVLISYAFGTHHHVERELPGILVRVAVYVLKPAQTGDGGALQAVRLRFTHFLVSIQGGVDTVVLLPKNICQGNCVFHGQLGAGTDGEMG